MNRQGLSHTKINVSTLAALGFTVLGFVLICFAMVNIKSQGTETINTYTGSSAVPTAPEQDGLPSAGVSDELSENGQLGRACFRQLRPFGASIPVRYIVSAHPVTD